MRTHSTQDKKSAPPTLFSPNIKQPDAIAPIINLLSEIDPEMEFVSALQNIAEDENFEFLFEIPGMLFELPCCNAAVIELDGMENDHRHVFVLCNPDNRTFSILKFSEIPAAAQSFFNSYVAVLACLSKIPAVSKLN